MTVRTNTPDRLNDNGSTTFTVKRACNGCSQYLGDVTDEEMARAVHGLPPGDVRGECAHCRPLVALEAAGCKTWQLTVRSYPRVSHEVDQLRPWVFSKGYWQEVDGQLQVVGLRVGQYPDHVVAFFGDWLVMDLEGRFSVHSAPAAEEQTLLTRTEAYLSAMHGSVARHDNLAANLGCAGCELRDQLRAALRRQAAEETL